VFERFREAYSPDPGASSGRGAWRPPELEEVEGYEEFAHEFAGATFGQGLYRFHDSQTGPRAWESIRAAFPEFGSRACPFACDWLGRQFAVDAGRTEQGRPLVLLLEPGTGEALEIPVPFVPFHDEELVDYAEAALLVDFFVAWSTSEAATLPLPQRSCVGYKVPLFLGGSDTIDNLEVVDVEMYWSLSGQLRVGLGLPQGTSIADVSITD
jgi:hypothetical protein